MTRKNQGKKTKLDKKTIGIIAGAIVAFLLIFLTVLRKPMANLFDNLFHSKKGEVSVITESTLTEVLEISELSTYRYPYNAIVRVYKDDEKTKLAYCVAYKGTVTAGINMSDVKVTVDNDNKIINIIVPKVEVHDAVVDAGSLDYIFKDDKYNTEKVISDAYSYCIEDLDERIEKDEVFKERAYENAKDALQALYKPWIEDGYKDYTLNIE